MYNIEFKDFIDIAENYGYVLISCHIVNYDNGEIMNVCPDLIFKFLSNSNEFKYETNYWIHNKFCRENIWIGSKYFVSILLRRNDK